jgi:hypothetical protein
MISLHDNARNPAKATREHKKTLWEKAVAECFLGEIFTIYVYPVNNGKS